MEPQDVESAEGENGTNEVWLKPRADTGMAWCMRFLVLFAVLVILAELALLIYLAVINKDVLFKFNQPVVTALPFSWSALLLPANFTLSTHDDSSAIHYAIELRIQPDLRNFNGSMTLDFTTTAVMPGLVLHARDLALTRATMTTSSLGVLEAKSITYDKNLEFAFLQYPKDVPVGLVRLTLEWSGLVGTGTEGLYRSEYVDESNSSGPKKVMLATQFEPTYARRVFPCFDQPDFRAFWTLTIEAPVSLGTHALSNSDLEVNPAEQIGDRMRFKFTKTVSAIPPYLVAFTLGDLVPLETTWGDQRRPLRVLFTRPSQQPLAVFALNAAAAFMSYFESVTRLPYQFNKLDLVAVPDFAYGAMENPGLITFRETALLTDAPADSASFASRMRVAEIVAHELAHQWYGNCLGPSNWNDLWIAEGSATFWSYQALDAVFPEWRYTANFFMTDEWAPALAADELLATPSLYRNVTSVAATSSIFDVTTYSKGASLLRQINATLSPFEMTRSMEEWFKRSVDGAVMNSVGYLKVITAEAASSRQNVGPNSAAFVFKPTFPVIDFSIPINSTTLQLQATMQSYSNFYAGSADTTAEWNIPLFVQTESGTVLNNFGVLSATSRNITVPATLNQNQWYKANPNGVYYYRTQYPVSNWNNLVAAVNANSPKLTTNDRVTLISDAFTFAEIGQLPYSVVFNLLAASLKPTERNYPIWRTALDELLVFDDLLQEQTCFPNFEAMMASYLTPAFEYWTWNISQVYENGNFTSVAPKAGDVSLRNVILSMGAEYIRTADYATYAIQVIDQYLADPVAHPLPVDTAANLIKVAISHGTQGLWLRTWNRYLTASNPTEKITLLRGLAWTESPAMIATLLRSTLDTTLIRSQDQVIVLNALTLNRHAGSARIWLFLRDNFATIAARFPQNLAAWFKTLSTSTNAHLVQEINQLLLIDYPNTGVDPSAITEIINDNVSWLNLFGSQICQFLTTTYPNVAKRAIHAL